MILFLNAVIDYYHLELEDNYGLYRLKFFKLNINA
jgi:hypothetical protein